MRHRGVRLPSVLLLTLAQACATVSLPSNIQLHGWSRISDDGDKPPGVAEPYFKVGPGDVIYLRRWAPGYVPPETIGRSIQSPSVVVTRLPLRRVKPREGAQLFSYEREFLLTVLATNRTSFYWSITSPAAKRALTKELRASEIALWNKLVDNLRVERVFVASNPEVLRLEVQMQQLVSPLSVNSQKAFLDESWEYRDVMGLEGPLETPFEAINERPTANDNYYYPSAKVALFNFVDVDRAGIDVNEVGVEERAWTLADWEESGACTTSGRTPTEISGFTPMGSSRTFQVVPTSEEATYRVRSTLVPEPRRWLEKKQGASWTTCATIATDDLRKLTVADVRSLTWGVKRGETLLRPEKCRIRRGAR